MERILAFDVIQDRFCRTALASVSAFRRGNDALGIEEFASSMEDLEQLFEINWRTGMKRELGGILPILHELADRIKNQDIVGITDLMEFSLCPAIKELNHNLGNEDCPPG